MAQVLENGAIQAVEHLRRMHHGGLVGRLVQAVPSFDLALGHDPSATPAAVEDLLASHRP